MTTSGCRGSRCTRSRFSFGGGASCSADWCALFSFVVVLPCTRSLFYFSRTPAQHVNFYSTYSEELSAVVGALMFQPKVFQFRLRCTFIECGDFKAFPSYCFRRSFIWNTKCFCNVTYLFMWFITPPVITWSRLNALVAAMDIACSIKWPWHYLIVTSRRIYRLN